MWQIARQILKNEISMLSIVVVLILFAPFLHPEINYILFEGPIV
jgi:hypothetical protein